MENKVTYHLAKRNELFPHLLTVLMRFGIYEDEEECPICKKKSKDFWTMVTPFKAQDFGGLFPILRTRVFEAGFLVCSDHLLVPELPPELLLLEMVDIPENPEERASKESAIDLVRKGLGEIHEEQTK